MDKLTVRVRENGTDIEVTVDMPPKMIEDRFVFLEEVMKSLRVAAHTIIRPANFR